MGGLPSTCDDMPLVELKYAWNLWLFATCINLRADLRIRLATHQKSVRKFWFCKLASTCIDLRVHLSRTLLSKKVLTFTCFPIVFKFEVLVTSTGVSSFCVCACVHAVILIKSAFIYIYKKKEEKRRYGVDPGFCERGFEWWVCLFNFPKSFGFLVVFFWRRRESGFDQNTQSPLDLPKPNKLTISLSITTKYTRHMYKSASFIKTYRPYS